MTFHTLFFLFVLMFHGISHAPPWNKTNGGDYSSPPVGDNLCESQQDKKLEGEFPAHCSCEKRENNIQKVQTCVDNYRNCWNACQNQVSACAHNRNIDTSSGCKSYCEDNKSNLQRLLRSSIVAKCKEQKEGEIKEALKDDCLSMIQKIPKPNPGAVLVCPDRDCDRFCENTTQNQDIGRMCSGITSQGGYDSCLVGLKGQLTSKLPQNPGRLPPGFAWENCDLRKPCEQRLSLAFQQTVRECGALKDRAVLCCNKPMECHKTPAVTGAIPPPRLWSWNGHE